MDYSQEYQIWLEKADPETVRELEAIAGDEDEIRDRSGRQDCAA